MITGASRMNAIVISVSPTSSRPGERARELVGLLALLVLQQLAEDRARTRCESAASATSARIRFGIWNASVKAEAAPPVPK